jgi:hypothetical protein
MYSFIYRISFYWGWFSEDMERTTLLFMDAGQTTSTSNWIFIEKKFSCYLQYNFEVINQDKPLLQVIMFITIELCVTNVIRSDRTGGIIVSVLASSEVQ